MSSKLTFDKTVSLDEIIESKLSADACSNIQKAISDYVEMILDEDKGELKENLDNVEISVKVKYTITLKV